MDGYFGGGRVGVGVALYATRCNCIADLWVILVSFTAITLCVASHRVYIIVVCFVIDSVQKFLDTPTYMFGTFFKILPSNSTGGFNWNLMKTKGILCTDEHWNRVSAEWDSAALQLWTSLSCPHSTSETELWQCSNSELWAVCVFVGWNSIKSPSPSYDPSQAVSISDESHISSIHIYDPFLNLNIYFKLILIGCFRPCPTVATPTCWTIVPWSWQPLPGIWPWLYQCEFVGQTSLNVTVFVGSFHNRWHYSVCPKYCYHCPLNL